MNFNDERTQGYLLTALSFFMWGMFPLFFKLYDKDVGSYEILIHRIIWSVVFLGFFITFRKELGQILEILKDKRSRNTLFLSGLMISANWWIYVVAVSHDQILQASLGQFLMPLISMGLGALVLKEPLSRALKVAISIVFIAVFIQVYALGEFPYIALILGFTFGFYGLIRKRAKIAAVAGIFIEALLLLPLSLAYLFYLQANGQNHFGINATGVLMIFSGVITVVPLVLFNIGTARINLTSVGFMQYIIPTMSIGFGVYFGEELGVAKILSFILIWIAIMIVTVDGLRQKRVKNAKR
ncbi:EamA family transporter RarD [Campylobacter suis]|uniref:Protein RarD n=1 Tax=Campylobacter suis TaxID=2790657 RepID=A0ABM8Q2S2_9BACT|nr:EamA family transporter RarD [Campylobacter suis]CAD7287127.1 Protein RarD [Campylobacter suis]